MSAPFLQYCWAKFSMWDRNPEIASSLLLGGENPPELNTYWSNLFVNKPGWNLKNMENQHLGYYIYYSTTILLDSLGGL